MFVFLSKLIPLFVYPVGLVALLLVAALLFGKHQKLSRGLVLSAFLILFLAGNRYVSNTLARSLEWRYSPPVNAPAPDVIIVLGGGTEPQLPPRATVELNAAGDRLLYASSLYAEYPGVKVLLSGGDIDFLDQSSSTPAEDMAEIMGKLGVPESTMILQGQSQNTYEDALYSCAMIKEQGFSSAWLVTSAFHMPRSVMVFEKQGCVVTPAPTDFTVTHTSWQKLWSPSFEEFVINLVPSYTNISLITKVMKEYIGMLTYSLQGWL